MWRWCKKTLPLRRLMVKNRAAFLPLQALLTDGAGGAVVAGPRVGGVGLRKTAIWCQAIPSVASSIWR
jgi:hypothetical protein